MSDDGAEPSDGSDGVDERVLAFLGTADRPRHLASDMATALDLPRGRVRTRLGALAADGRVVRTDAEGTARWAVPDRVDEPDGAPGAEADETNGTDDVGVSDVADGDAPRVPSGTETSPGSEGASGATVATDRSGVEARRRGAGVAEVAIAVLALAVVGAALRRFRRRR